jgi:hypothetical protein
MNQSTRASGALHGQLEVLGRIDALELVERRGQEIRGDFLVLEEQPEIWIGVDAGAAGDLAVLQLYPAALGLVLQLELRDAITLFQACRELRVHGRACAHGLRDTPQDDR